MKETEAVKHRLQDLNKSIEDSVEFGVKVRDDSKPFVEIYHLDMHKKIDDEESKNLFDKIIDIAEESKVGFEKVRVKLQSKVKRKIVRVKSALEKYEFDTVQVEDLGNQYFLDGEIKI